MIGRIKKALDKMITNSNWMDNVTKQKAIQKSSQIKPMVGYPDVVLDVVKLQLHKAFLQSLHVLSGEAW